jgi:hypothetical protein
MVAPPTRPTSDRSSSTESWGPPQRLEHWLQLEQERSKQPQALERRRLHGVLARFFLAKPPQHRRHGQRRLPKGPWPTAQNAASQKPERVGVVIKLLVNGRQRVLDIEPEMPLLWVLRDELGLRAGWARLHCRPSHLLWGTPFLPLLGSACEVCRSGRPSSSRHAAAQPYIEKTRYRRGTESPFSGIGMSRCEAEGRQREDRECGLNSCRLSTVETSGNDHAQHVQGSLIRRM